MTYLFRTPDTKITHFFVRQLIKELHIMTGNRYMYIHIHINTPTSEVLIIQRNV